uniref:Abasic site processing protein HMCES n=1 Tax=Equus asinus TaxID=9793 RepID=A0A9L0IWI7_EQUAS
MCGRISCHLPRDVLTRACAYRNRQGERRRLPEWRDADKYCPSYNKSPRSSSPVLLSRLHFEKSADSSERIIVPMRWGLVPSWFQESDPSKLLFNTANCRSDTIMEKRSFRSGSIGAADSPEDWNKVWDNWRLLTMAGIFDCWEPPEGGDHLYSYTIITVDACKVLNDIHQRMPAILDGEEAVSKWLDFGEVSTQEALKLIHPTENITFHPVSFVVNNCLNNTPDCLTPVDLSVIKQLKARGCSHRMLQWLARNSPTKEDPKTPQKTESDVRQFLPKSPSSVKRSSAVLLEQWLKQEKEEEPVAKQLHSE